MRGKTDESFFAFIGRNIRAQRRERKWTQTELGQKLGRRKLSRQAIHWIESGKNTDLETIADIAATLGVSVDVLTTRSTTKAPGAGELVDALLARRMSSWSRVASRDPRYRSPGVIRTLLDRSDREYDNKPLRCRAICEVATELLDRLDGPDEAGASELRVRAWKDLAHVTATLGEHDNALAYLQKAESAAATGGNPEHQMGIVELERSLVSLMAERYAEARKHLFAARPALEKHDRRRFWIALHTEAVLEAVSGDPHRAAVDLDRLIGQAESWNEGDPDQHDDDMHRIYSSAAYAWYRAGDTERAVEYTRKSEEIHRKREREAEMARDIGRRASLTAILGDPAGAFPKYEEARKRLAAVGLQREVIDMDFFYLYAKCVAGADPRELHEICSRLVSASLAARLPVTACHAIDWLRRISAHLTPDSVTAVQGFVLQSELRPDLPFEPPKTNDSRHLEPAPELRNRRPLPIRKDAHAENLRGNPEEGRDRGDRDED